MLVSASVIPMIYFSGWYLPLVESGRPRTMAFGVTAGGPTILFGQALRSGSHSSDLAIALVSLVPFLHLIALNLSIGQFTKRTGHKPQSNIRVRGAPWADRLFNATTMLLWFASYFAVAFFSDPYVI